ncbi:UNVERIFIED_CONTAM: hypothetical protein Sindi_2890300 [Sesamum indicum]
MDFHIEEDCKLFMSDKQKGLVGTLEELFPNAEHRFCARHLHLNFKTFGFRGLALKNGLWKAARATTVNQFNARMQELKELDEGAYAWFSDKHPKEWSRSHFFTYPSNTLEARDKPILSMLEWLMEYFMKRLQVNRDRALKKWKRTLCPKIQKIIDKIIEKFGDCIPIKKWDLSRIPCKHAVGAIFCQGEDIEKYRHQCYRVQTYLKAYQHIILPINGREEWKKSAFNPLVSTKACEESGEPPKSRRLEADETMLKRKRRKTGPIIKEGASKIKRQQTTVKCGKCGIEGHNARGCPSKTMSNEHIPYAFSQVPPNDAPHKLQEHVLATAPLFRKLKGKRPPKQAAPAPAPSPAQAHAPAPTMFAQFQ